MTPAPVDPSLFEAIGKITVTFELLSQFVELGVWFLLFGCDNIQDQRMGQIVTAERSFRQNVDLLACLYKHRYPSQGGEELNRLCEKLQHIEDERNKVMHSRWIQHPAPASVLALLMKTTAKRKTGFKFQSQETKLSEVAGIVNDITKAASELLRFVSIQCCKEFEKRPR